MTALLAIINILNSALAVLPAASSLYADFTAKRDAAQALVDAGTDPTPEQWAALDASVAAQESQIDTNAKG